MELRPTHFPGGRGGRILLLLWVGLGHAAGSCIAEGGGADRGGDPGPVHKLGTADDSTVGGLPDSSEELFRAAATAFANGDAEAARQAYLAILAKHPDNALTLVNLATVEHRAGDHSAALARLDKAVAINPKLAQAWVLKGLIHFTQGDNHLAISALARALHEDPLDPRPHNYLSVVIKDLGWLHGARQELLRAIELDPSYADAHFNLALLYLEQRPPARELARRHYARALELGSRPDPLAERQINADGEEGSGNGEKALPGDR